MKLPKQWNHWVKMAGLRHEASNKKWKRQHWSKFSLIGHGRHWRVNCLGQFQMSEVHATFDRWANSTERTEQVPTTKKEFVNTVNRMLKG